MTTPTTPESLLQQIAGITSMEQGKLCILRQGPNGPYYNLQRWEDGRNVSEYIPADQVPVVQANVASYGRFEGLVGEYAQFICARSREQRETGVKKKRESPTSSSPKRTRFKRS